jgi:hypothetical protein
MLMILSSCNSCSKIRFIVVNLLEKIFAKINYSYKKKLQKGGFYDINLSEIILLVHKR